MSGVLLLPHWRFDTILRCILFNLDGFQCLVFFRLGSLPFLVLLDLPFAVIEILIHFCSPLKALWEKEYSLKKKVELILWCCRLSHNR